MAKNIDEEFPKKIGSNDLENEIESLKKCLDRMMRKIEALENSRINDETKIKRVAGASKNNKLTRMRKEFVEWSLVSNFNCYTKIFQTNVFWMKIVWALLFLIFTSVTA